MIRLVKYLFGCRGDLAESPSAFGSLCRSYFHWPVYFRVGQGVVYGVISFSLLLRHHLRLTSHLHLRVMLYKDMF